jgi:O-antigen/teichoic acid export membrane protein
MDLRDDERPYVREEPEWQRLDRNFTELLQELRVAQTGVQILFAFLLSIAFQQRFLALAEYQRDIYLATLVSAACAAVLLIAPVAVHRVLFRRNLKNAIVAVASRLAAGGLFFLALAVVMAVLFVVDVVAGPVAGIVISATIAMLVAVLWAVLPLRVRLRHTVVDATAPFDPGGAPGRSRT